MKSRSHSFVRFSTLVTAAALAFATSAQAADFTWDGGTGNWSDTNWNGATASGPTTAGNTATINSGGNVTANVGVGALDSVTLGSGSQLNFYNGVYQGLGNLILQGGTVSGSGNYNAYGASVLGNVTVSGSAASTITGSSWFNLGSSTTFTVADATGDAASDLLVNLSLRSLPGSPDTSYLYNSKIIKEGAGTMEVTVHSYFNGGLDLNAGTLKLSGGNGGYGFFDGTVTVNSGTTLTIDSDGTGFGYQGGWKPTSVNIVGGTVNGGGHIFGISGGVNMTGGTLDSSGGFQWNYTNLNTNASANTATVSGPLNLRGDGGYTTMAVNVADGAAATDLLISGNITQGGTMGITKSGAGTMELSGANSYTGGTVVNEGTLVLSGASSASNSITVNTTGTLSLSSPILGDVVPVVIASGAVMNLNFIGNDTVGSLDIDGSGSLPADTYNSSHPIYGSYFTGAGSLVVLGANGTWTSLVDGNWSDATNWAGNTIAAGYDSTATFNAATGVTVTLDSDRILGNLAFDVSDYIIAGANTLALQAIGTPTISVTPGRTATIAVGLSGSLGLEKTGDGNLVFTGVKTYTGGTFVAGGSLELAGGNSGDSIIRGTLTIDPGATVSMTGGDGSGFGWNNPVTTITVNGGTLNAAGGSHLGFGSAASLTLDSGASVLGNWQWNGDGLLTVSTFGDTTNTISGNLTLRGDAGASHSFSVDDGAAAVDLQINANLSDQWPEINWVPASGLTKNGPGVMVLNGTNTFDGNTLVNDGALEVTATSGLQFRPTTNGATNAVSGTSTSSLSFLGTVHLELGDATITNGNAWTLFDLASFTGPTPALTPIAVTSTLGAFSKSGTTWTLLEGANTWTFEEGTGVLSLVVAGGLDYDTWAATFGLPPGSEGGDLDNDGVTNGEEHAFGLLPNSGASVNPIAVPLDTTLGTFSYTRRLLSPTDLEYSIWYSTDLSGWTQDTGAIEGTPVVNGEVETVPVTLTNSLLSNPSLFIQVRAE